MPMVTRFRPGWGLGTRLALVTSLFAIPLVIVAILTYRANIDERRAAEARNALLIAQTVAATVDGFTRDLENLTLAVALGLGPAPWWMPMVVRLASRAMASAAVVPSGLLSRIRQPGLPRLSREEVKSESE